jgi:RNase H-fold protein (predicted Holliday junction resolvase)
MVGEYYCECCNYFTTVKCNYNKHLCSKKHKKSTQSQHLVNKKSTFSQQLVNPVNLSKIPCKYCDKRFTTKQAMYRHIKYTCKKNKDEDLKELARLLNETKEENKRQQRQIDKLTKKLQIQNLTINANHNNQHNIQNNNIHIQLLNHDKTDYSHLTERDYVKCIKDCNHCVKTLIEKVHFNPTKPENMNIYISNIKNNYVMLYKCGQWNIVDRNEQIDDLYEFNELVLEQWYDRNNTTNPELIKSFERYLQNKNEGDDMLNNVKHKILLLLYNKRNMVDKNIDTLENNVIILEEKVKQDSDITK